MAFADCTSLASVTCWATSVPTLGTNAFSNNKDGRNIYVLSDVVNTYKEAENWSDYAGNIKAMPTSLPANAITGDFEGNWCTYYNSGCNVQVDNNTTIYTISAASGSTATLHKVTGKIIKAGEGVILKSTASSISNTTTTKQFSRDFDYFDYEEDW